MTTLYVKTPAVHQPDHDGKHHIKCVTKQPIIIILARSVEINLYLFMVHIKDVFVKLSFHIIKLM